MRFDPEGVRDYIQAKDRGEARIEDSQGRGAKLVFEGPITNSTGHAFRDGVDYQLQVGRESVLRDNPA